MAILPTYWREVHPARRRSLVWPREHGAWGILLVSLITGSAIGLSSTANLPRLLWLTIAVAAAFCIRTPFENSLPASPFRPRDRAEWRWVIGAAGIYTLCGAFAIVMLVRGGALDLIWKPGVAAAGFFALQAFVKRTGRAGRLPGGVIGAFGLALAAVAGWAVAAGGIERQALTLWILNGLFATDQIVFVQLRIREARCSGAVSCSRNRLLLLAGEALVALLLISGAVTGFIPSLSLIAFLPVLVRGGIWALGNHHRRLQIHRLGKSELFHSILFGHLLMIAFRFHIP